MTVLRHALCGDDFHQTPVGIIFSEMFKVFFSVFVGDATQVVLPPLLLLSVVMEF